MNNRTYKIKENYFETIDSEEKAYFLGLLFADGSNTGKYYTRLELKEEDEYIIRKLRNAIYPRKEKAKLFYRKFSVEQNSVLLCISSKKISEDLTRIGCVKSKSLILEFPKIEKHYVRHFIRGYFDGDGSIVYSDKKRAFSILGTIPFLEEVKNILKCELNVNDTKIIKPKKESKIYRLAITSTKDIINTYHYMYDQNSICLKRKLKRFKLIEKDVLNGKIKWYDKYSKYKGVTFDKDRNKWISYYGKKSLGRFNSEDEAYKFLTEYKSKYEKKTSINPKN